MRSPIKLKDKKMMITKGINLTNRIISIERINVRLVSKVFAIIYLNNKQQFVAKRNYKKVRNKYRAIKKKVIDVIYNIKSINKIV